MKLENFKSGTYKQQYEYKSFSPSFINEEWTWETASINTLFDDAADALSKMDAFSHIVPNVDLFISMHVKKEAKTSSKIEGTKTEMDEVIMDEDEISPEKRDDWQEVQNYIKAMDYALNELKTLPLSSRLLKNTHKILMDGVRGERKTPGEFRQSQNWIGGSNLKSAFFIPPVHTEIPDLITDMETFWHNRNISVPHLIRVAISHYQFETIHPFLEGNGRIGRLLIPLYLVNCGRLTKPSLYLSDYFERNKGAYYDALTVVRASNDMVHWVKFFLSGIIETAKSGINTFENILRIKDELDKKIISLGKKAENGHKLLLALYKKPIIDSEFTQNLLDVTPATANTLLSDFEKLGILREKTGYKRNRMYVFDEYLDLFR